MADGPAFSVRLTALGFDQPARAALTMQGLTTTTDLCSLSLSDINKLIAHIQHEVRNQPPDPNNPRPTFPFLAVKRLQALFLWCIYRLARGQQASPADFNAAAMVRWERRLHEIERNSNDEDVKTAGPLESFNDWVQWEEALLTWAANVRSARTNVPLQYLLRSHSDVTVEALNAQYETIDEDLIATTLLAGEDYEHDNQQLYDSLKAMNREGPGWPFLQQFNRRREGRGAYLALKAQAEGQSAVESRKLKAYTAIETARYTGKSNFSFDNYIARHQRAHNELLALDEPVAEGKKVKDFLRGISDPALQISKKVVVGDPAKLGNFELCQQYLKTVTEMEKTSIQTDPKRHIAKVRQTAKQKKASAAKARTETSGAQSPPHYGHYTAEAYRELTDAQKIKLKKSRGEKRKSSAVAVVSERGEPPRKVKNVKIRAEEQLTEKADDKPKANAGDQFGRASHPKQGGEETDTTHLQTNGKDEDTEPSMANGEEVTKPSMTNGEEEKSF